MKHRAKTKRSTGSSIALWTSIVLFALVVAVMGSGIFTLSAASAEEGIAATRSAIERAAVLCYATEGFYPPGLSYIEANYGVVIDETRYVVNYEVFASNVMPVIRVSGR